MRAELDVPDINGLLAEALAPVQPSPDRAKALRLRFLDRVQLSAAAHREYTTVRRGGGAWLPAAGGVTRRLLRSDASTRVEIVRLAPGAALPWPDDASAQEILLLDGALTAPGGARSPSGVPGAMGYCARQRQAPGEPWVATTESTVYLRHQLGNRSALPALEAQWWGLPEARPAQAGSASATSAWVDPGRRRWFASSPGVEVLPLRGNSEVVSMLVRFGAGASVPDHGHALDEDCLVLQGEMFLGDILLRSGDYQLAPAGGSHFGETSDVGVLFFFHGALDPVLRGEPAASP